MLRNLRPLTGKVKVLLCVVLLIVCAESLNQYDLRGVTSLFLLHVISFIALVCLLVNVFMKKEDCVNKRLLFLVLIYGFTVNFFWTINTFLDLHEHKSLIERGPINVFSSRDYGTLIKEKEIGNKELSTITKSIAKQNFIWLGKIDVYIDGVGDIAEYVPTQADKQKRRNFLNKKDFLEIRMTASKVRLVLSIILFIYFLVSLKV